MTSQRTRFPLPPIAGRSDMTPDLQALIELSEKSLRMALQHIRICAPDPTIEAALEAIDLRELTAPTLPGAGGGDGVAELVAAAREYVGTLADDPDIGWRGGVNPPSHKDKFRCERCGQESLDSGEIPHTKSCKSVRLIAALAALPPQQGG